MAEPSPQTRVPVSNYGTSLVDRVNLALYLRRYLKLIGRRWIVLFTCTFLGLAFALYKVVNMQSAYVSVAELEITRKIQVGGPSGAMVLDPMDSFYPDQLRIMNSGALRARVLSMIRSAKKPIAEPLNSSFTPLRGAGSSFRLIAETADPEYSRAYASNWARAFLDYKKDQLMLMLENKKYSFYQDILRQGAQLEKCRAETEKFRKENQIGSASDTFKAAQAQLDQLKTEQIFIETQHRLLEGASKEALASGSLANQRPQSAPGRDSANSSGTMAVTDTSDPLSKFGQDTSYVTYKGELGEKLTQLTTLTNTLKPKHPVMVKLNRDIELLNQRLSFQLQTVEEKRKATIESLRLHEEALRSRIEDLTKQVQGLRGKQDEFERLKQEEARVEATIASLKNTIQQIDLGTSDEAQFNVVGDVQSYQKPMERSRTLLQGIGGGLLLGLALVYLLHRMDDRLELAEDIEEELQEPMLGQIPQVDMRSVREGRLLVTKLHRHNMFAESIRGVRSAIMLGSHQGRRQAVLVSSAVPGDGKTTFTVNFAATMAIAGNRVLLIDADLRRGNIHNYFGLPREGGLSEVLEGKMPWRQAVHATEVPQLRVITTGELPTHPGELLVGPIMAQMMEELRKEFDYIVLDCPPLTAIDDTFSVIGLMDGLLFVVRSGQTSMRFAKTALAAVRQRGAAIIGLVLNGITSDNPYYYYNYYYHAYYNNKDGKSESDPSKVSESPSVESKGTAGQTEDDTEVRRRRRQAQKSIMGEAMAQSGEAPSERVIEAQLAAKAEVFKARRAANRSAKPMASDGVSAAGLDSDATAIVAHDEPAGLTGPALGAPGGDPKHG